ncbi:MAG: glycosyltransferase family 2 protein, partial [Candidatus Latescibacteria bacterium]|nr:glycosyltransferase family 2 protein [Candidatus Latescibacterota bacterium]
NLGFTVSCNRGLARAHSRYAVLLNDDTIVAADWLRPLVEAAEADPRLAACQPKLLSVADPGLFDYAGAAGGYIDGLGYTFCRGRLFDHRERDEGQYDRPAPLFWACGAALFLRLDAVKQVGLLDEDYYMHFEEIDLCWRLRLAGYRILAVPASVIHHHSGWSLPPSSYRKAYLNYRNNLVLLCKNLELARLCWVLPLRLALDLCSSLLFLAKGQFAQIPAPLAALAWLITHPLQVWRRRRQSQSLRRPAGSPRRDGVYAGCLVYQYYVRGVRRAGQLLPEAA